MKTNKRQKQKNNNEDDSKSTEGAGFRKMLRLKMSGIINKMHNHIIV